MNDDLAWAAWCSIGVVGLMAHFLRPTKPRGRTAAVVWRWAGEVICVAVVIACLTTSILLLCLDPQVIP